MTTILRGRPYVPAAALLAAILFTGSNALAQQKGDHLPGAVGLQSGSQPPPGIYLGYLIWAYPTDTIKDDDGDRIGSGDNSLTSTLQGPVVVWVTPFTLAGGHIGGQVALPFIRNRIDTNSLDVDTGLAYTDTILSPFGIGWHRPQADMQAAYNLYLPTGKFEAGGSDNAGLGMLGQEVTFAATGFFDKTHLWHAAGSAGYEWHTKKNDLDLRVGQIMTVEWGAGRSFHKKVDASPLPLITTIGVVGYSQFKVTEDSGSARSPLLAGLKDRVHAIGAEASIFIPQARLTVVGRVLPEFGARLRTQGTTVSVQVVYVAKSLVRRP